MGKLWQAYVYIRAMEEHEDIHISEGPYEVNTEDKHFYSEEGQ